MLLRTTSTLSASLISSSSTAHAATWRSVSVPISATISSMQSKRDDTGSEFSDFDSDGEEQLRHLLDSIGLNRAEPVLPEERLADDAASPTAKVPLQFQSQGGHTSSVEARPVPSGAAVAVQLHGRRRKADNTHEESPGRIRWEEPDGQPEDVVDTRSPIKRFRTAPKKPLSVTDLVSPAWCELQYWFNLTKYGKVKRTPQMRKGTDIHKILEEEVHQTVPVDVQTKEDNWGLKIWNVIQGLRTLRVTGMTREIQLWGTIDGHVINGIIDELSFTCTDRQLEDAISKSESTGSNEPQLPSDQQTISQFFQSQGGHILENNVPMVAKNLGAENARKTYLTDVKTRGSRYLPNNIAMRPTFMQLMLYRRLLSDMASDSVDVNVIFQRHGLNPSARFSDSLIAQLSALEFNFSSQSTEESYAPESNVDTVVELLTHNSLLDLWALMTEEFRKTMPRGADSISKVLKTEFRNPEDGAIIGVKTFPYRHDDIEAYIADEMKWWKGEREARGVEVEEAFKCRSCEFAEGCSWRLNKIEDAVRASRARPKHKEEGKGWS